MLIVFLSAIGAVYLLMYLSKILIKKITETAVIIVFQRIFIKNLTFRMLVNIHFEK